jgi:hypothetical protein
MVFSDDPQPLENEEFSYSNCSNTPMMNGDLTREFDKYLKIVT